MLYPEKPEELVKDAKRWLLDQSPPHHDIDHGRRDTRQQPEYPEEEASAAVDV